MENNSEELKACPFCGGEASFTECYDMIYTWKIECDGLDCGISTTEWSDECKEDCIKSWNTRHVEPIKVDNTEIEHHQCVAINILNDAWFKNKERLSPTHYGTLYQEISYNHYKVEKLSKPIEGADEALEAFKTLQKAELAVTDAYTEKKYVSDQLEQELEWARDGVLGTVGKTIRKALELAGGK